MGLADLCDGLGTLLGSHLRKTAPELRVGFGGRGARTAMLGLRLFALLALLPHGRGEVLGQALLGDLLDEAHDLWGPGQ